MPARRSSWHRRAGLLAGWLGGWVAGTDEPASTYGQAHARIQKAGSGQNGTAGVLAPKIANDPRGKPTGDCVTKKLIISGTFFSSPILVLPRKNQQNKQFAAVLGPWVLQKRVLSFNSGGLRDQPMPHGAGRRCRKTTVAAKLPHSPEGCVWLLFSTEKLSAVVVTSAEDAASSLLYFRTAKRQGVLSS